MTIEGAKEYLKAMICILKNYKDPTGMNAKTCECITALLDHCESLEVKILQMEENRE